MGECIGESPLKPLPEVSGALGPESNGGSGPTLAESRICVRCVTEFKAGKSRQACKQSFNQPHIGFASRTFSQIASQSRLDLAGNRGFHKHDQVILRKCGHGSHIARKSGREQEEGRG